MNMFKEAPPLVKVTFMSLSAIAALFIINVTLVAAGKLSVEYLKGPVYIIVSLSLSLITGFSAYYSLKNNKDAMHSNIGVAVVLIIYAAISYLLLKQTSVVYLLIVAFCLVALLCSVSKQAKMYYVC